MSSTLFIRNRQCALPVNTRYLRRLLRWLLRDWLGSKRYDLGIYVVHAPEMMRLNETFLGHKGPTDVITFDYSTGTAMHGEIFVCIDEAVAQARQFRTSWQSELVRYIVHGLLHLNGYDDRRATNRHLMRHEENRLLRQLGRSFVLAGVAGRSPSRRRP